MAQTHSTVTILDRPMVLIPLAEYNVLLAEAGERPTPRLDQVIAKARARFKKNKAIPWKTIKRAL